MLSFSRSALRSNEAVESGTTCPGRRRVARAAPPTASTTAHICRLLWLSPTKAMLLPRSSSAALEGNIGPSPQHLGASQLHELPTQRPDEMRPRQACTSQLRGADIAVRGNAEVFEEVLMRVEDAESTWRELLDIDPDDQGALQRLAKTYEAAGSTEQLIEVLVRRIESSTDDHKRRELRMQLSNLQRETLKDRAAEVALHGGRGRIEPLGPSPRIASPRTASTGRRRRRRP